MSDAITVLVCKVAEVKQDMSEHTECIDGAEGRVAAAEEELEKLQAEFAWTVKQLTYLEAKNLENWSSRKNLRMFGLREHAKGTRPLHGFIWEMAGAQIPVQERVHRTLAPAKPNQHRAILVCFWKFQDKQTVYCLSSQNNILHDGAKLTFVQDFSAETMRRSREFNTARKLFTEKEIFWGFQLNPYGMRMVHDGNVILFSSLREAAKFHSEIQPKGQTLLLTY